MCIRLITMMLLRTYRSDGNVLDIFFYLSHAVSLIQFLWFHFSHHPFFLSFLLLYDWLLWRLTIVVTDFLLWLWHRKWWWYECVFLHIHFVSYHSRRVKRFFYQNIRKKNWRSGFIYLKTMSRAKVSDELF